MNSTEPPVRRRDYWASKFDGQRHTLVRGRDFPESVDERQYYDRARAAARRAIEKGLVANVVVTYSREWRHVIVKAE
jgi:hypothetical protein